MHKCNYLFGTLSSASSGDDHYISSFLGGVGAVFSAGINNVIISELVD